MKKIVFAVMVCMTWMLLANDADARPRGRQGERFLDRLRDRDHRFLNWSRQCEPAPAQPQPAKACPTCPTAPKSAPKPAPKPTAEVTVDKVENLESYLIPGLPVERLPLPTPID